jgi:hypothetical protein
MTKASDMAKALEEIVYDNEFESETGFAAAALLLEQEKVLDEAENLLSLYARMFKSDMAKAVVLSIQNVRGS